jgi:DNA repair exonuclease SbcCD ATPase subunit
MKQEGEKGESMACRMEHMRVFFFAALGFAAAGCVLDIQPKPVNDLLQEITYLEKVTRESQETGTRAEANLKLARLYRNHRNPQINYEKSRKALETYLLLSPVEGRTEEVLDWLTVFRKLEGLQNENEKIRKDEGALKRQKEAREKSLVNQMKGQESLQTDIQQLQERLETLEKEYLSLKTVNEGLRGSIHSLQETNSGLIEANKRLQADNQQMRGTIERLKVLDQQMEERREEVK